MSKSVQAELFAGSLCKGVLESEALRRSFAADTTALLQRFRYQLCHVLWAGIAKVLDLMPATCA